MTDQVKGHDWTPEPWRVINGCEITDGKTDKKDLSDEQFNANAKRIVSCVNALAGLSPSAVSECVEALEKIANIDDGWTTEIKMQEIAKQALDKVRMKA